jgi:hypothetical protein
MNLTEIKNNLAVYDCEVSQSENKISVQVGANPNFSIEITERNGVYELKDFCGSGIQKKIQVEDIVPVVRFLLNLEIDVYRFNIIDVEPKHIIFEVSSTKDVFIIEFDKNEILDALEYEEENVKLNNVVGVSPNDTFGNFTFRYGSVYEIDVEDARYLIERFFHRRKPYDTV